MIILRAYYFALGETCCRNGSICAASWI